MKKLKNFFRTKWLILFKVIAVAVVFGTMVPMFMTSLKFVEQRGKDLGKVEISSISSSYYTDEKSMETLIREFRPTTVYPNQDYHPYQYPAKNLNEFTRYKSSALRIKAIYQKIDLERTYEDADWSEGYYSLDVARNKITEIDSLITNYQSLAEQKFGKEVIAQSWQEFESSSYSRLTMPVKWMSDDHVQKSYLALLPLLVPSFIFWLVCSFSITALYNVCKLKEQRMRIWCEVLNLRLFRVSSVFFVTLITDSYPKHGVAEQLKTVRRTCATALSVLMSLASAGYGVAVKAQSNSGSTSQKTPYELIVENRTNLPLDGNLSKTEIGFRVMVTRVQGGEFTEDVISHRLGRINNLLVAGKWFTMPVFKKFANVKIGPYFGWRFVKDKLTREDSLVLGSKISFNKVLSKSKQISFNFVAPVLQIERSLQKKRFAFANASQAFFNLSKQKLNLGLEYSYRKIEKLRYSGYIGPILAKRIVLSGKSVLRSISGEIGVFKEIPVGDWRIRGRFTFVF